MISSETVAIENTIELLIKTSHLKWHFDMTSSNNNNHNNNNNQIEHCIIECAHLALHVISDRKEKREVLRKCNRCKVFHVILTEYDKKGKKAIETAPPINIHYL